MATDSGKDDDKDRHKPVRNGGGDTLRRIEMITGTGRRRRWDAETKGRLVAESFEPGRSVSESPGVTTSAPVFCFFGGGRRRKPRKMPRATCEAARHSYRWWWPVTRQRRLWRTRPA